MKKLKPFVCFRPSFPIKTEQHEAAGAGDSNRRKPIASAVVKSPVLDTRSRRSKSSRSFSRVVKSILFEASLKERVNNKSSEERSRRSTKLGESSQKIDEFVNPIMSPSNSFPEAGKSWEEKKQSDLSRSNSVTVGDCSSCYKGQYLILITLCITILCGRVYAILLMSLWVQCSPRRRRTQRPETETGNDDKKNHHNVERINVLRETEFSRV